MIVKAKKLSAKHEKTRGKQVAAVVPIEDLPIEQKLAAGDWLALFSDLGAEGRELGEELERIVQARAGRPPGRF